MDHSIKSSLLKKYEAGPDILQTQGENPATDFYSPFGPMIANVQTPPALLDRINAYADGKLSSDKGREIMLPREVCFDGGEAYLEIHTGNMIKRCLAGMENTTVIRVEYENFWIVSQYAGTPSPVHLQAGDLSGVMYLKVLDIEEGEEARTYISGRNAGYFNFLIGGKQRFSKSLIRCKPRVGDDYIFPGWLFARRRTVSRLGRKKVAGIQCLRYDRRLIA
jgi:hypothetical protein